MLHYDKLLTNDKILQKIRQTLLTENKFSKYLIYAMGEIIQLSIEFFIEEIEVEGNMAYAVTSSKGTVKIHTNGVEAPEATRELFVFEKVYGEWKIARYMFNKTEPKG